MDIPNLLPGTLYMLILRTLASEPLHGYGIAKRIKDTSSNILQVEEGSLYPALQRMLVKGWLEAEWGASDNNRRARYYRLTKTGEQQLAKETAGFHLMMRAIAQVLETA